MVIRYSLYRVNTVAWLKVSNRSLFFLRRLLSQNGARVSPKYISFRNLFCPFNDGLNRWASDEHTQHNTKMNVTVIRREVYSPQSTGIFKSRAIFYFTLPGHKSEPAMGLRQVWQVATCNRRFKFLARLLPFFLNWISGFVLHAVSVVWLSAPLRRMIIYVCILWNTWPP